MLQKKQKLFSVILLLSFSLLLYIIYLKKQIPFPIIFFYAVINSITFLFYLKDKRAAESGKWRTPEKTLHFLSILGGWLGANIAQNFIRHKSNKLSFKVIYWVTIILNCAILYLITTLT